MLFKRFFIALTLLLAFASGASAAEFYNSAIQMGTSYCPEASFDCEKLTSAQSEIIEAANECISSRLKINERIMSDFKHSGEYENCVLSGQPSKSAGGTNVWVICCVKKESNSETCGMSCTRYIDQK